jgi:tetratricopeptide (TPR) repeat protein
MAGRTKSTITLGLRGGGRDLLEQAQAIMYRAWETPDRKRRQALAQKALQVSPDCADAYVLLAEESTALDQAVELYRKGVEAGERALGRQAFKDAAGHFWGFFETRPYMRARAGLAQSLWEAGRHDEALAHYHDLLHLNPNDNQGLRYIMASGLLELGRDEQVADLLNAYPDDAAAAWPWTGALLAFRQQGDCSNSRGKLAVAHESNPHVPAYLLGRKKLPRRLPDSVGFGDDSEAVCYATENLNVWQKTPGALAWLAQNIVPAKATILN